MTRKDYIILARVLKKSKPDFHPQLRGALIDGWARICKEISAALDVDNPRFDRARFLQACGVEEE